ncbi:MAG TPA: FAD-dependent oxidoreductase [Polyangiaceae bacterium]
MASRTDVLGVLSLPRFTASRLTKPRARAAAATRERLIVVGNGMVGQRFCEILTKLDGSTRYDVVVLGEETTPAYDRVHLTDIWKGRSPEELQLRESDWYSKHGVELRLGECVSELNTTARTVTTRSAEVLSYDRLVFATGSHVPELKLELDDGVEVLRYRTLEDAQLILQKVEAAGRRRVVVVGAGLLGLEAARALQKLNCEVTVLELSSQLLPRQLDAVAAGVLEGTLRAAGLDLRTRCRLTRIVRGESGYLVHLEGEESIAAEVVVAAVGARATDAVAKAAGLTCDVRGGIRVDDKLRTSKAGVYAIGECAHHPRVPHGLVAPGYAMADVLAHNLMGRRERLSPQESVTRLKLDLTEVTVLGNPLASNAGDDWVWQAEGVYRRLVVSADRVKAAVCVGAWPELPTLQRLVTRRQRVTKKTLEHFAETGNLGLVETSLSVQSLPDAAVICNCASVSCGTLRRAILAGNSDVRSLGRATSAGTLCGSCQPHLAVLCGADPAPAPNYPRAGRALVILSAAALVAACVTLAFPRVPVATSVQLESLDVLWLDASFKQISGFVLIGLVAAGLMLSLRKRVRRFQWGHFPGWRVLHASVGLGAVFVAFVHTGFRLGYNLNFALMLAFLASAFTGAVSGAFFAKASSMQAKPAVRLVRGVRTLHDWVFWPFLVLVSFHVLKVYYF